MSERIDQWAVYDGDRSLAAFISREAAVEWIGGNAKLRLVHRVELRENDEITPKGKLAEVQKLLGEMTDRALKAEAATHADDAVDPVRTFKIGDRVREILYPENAGTVIDINDDGLRMKWDDGVEGRDHWDANTFEYADGRKAPKSESNAAGRPTATEVNMRAMSSDYESRLKAMTARASAAESALNDAAGKYERETAAKLLVEVYCSNCADNGDYSDEVANATSVAALLRSHYFPPAKEVSNG